MLRKRSAGCVGASTRGCARALAGVGLVVCAASAQAAAQGLPAEPLAFFGGSLVVSGEASIAAAPADNGFFNFTDYEQSSLRLARFSLLTSWSLGDRVSVLSELRAQNGRPFDVHALFLRVHPWPSRAVTVQIGRIPPTFGGFARRGYGVGNALIGYPLSYQYLTSLRPDALPASADDLLRMRGAGWRSSFPVGDQTPRPGLPPLSEVRWDTGVQVSVGDRPLQAVASVTTGSLSNPLVVDDNAGKQLSGRLTYRPSAGLAIGVSVSRAAYLTREATDQAHVGNHGTFTQRAVGADVEFSRDHWLVRAEGLLTTWRVPRIDAPFIESPLGAAGLWVEGQYKLRPGFYVAGRADTLRFSRITGTREAGRATPWEFPVTRIEVGAGYSVWRNATAKVGYQHNWRENPRQSRTGFLTAQLVYWF